MAIDRRSVLSELLRQMPQLRSHLYFKSSLTALSHAMEDRVLAGTDRPLLIASFQQENFTVKKRIAIGGWEKLATKYTS